MLKNYKELKVWQKSYQLCLDIYKITKGFSKDEKSGDPGYIKSEPLKEVQKDLAEVEKDAQGSY